MKNNFPKIPLIVSILFFVFSCSALVLFYRFLNKSNIDGDTAVLEWHREARRRDEIKELDYSIKVIERERAELQKHFARSSDIVPFLDRIERMGPSVQVKAEVSSVDILENNSGLAVGIKASGNFEDIYKFITLLENSPYELEFTGVEMHKTAQGESEGSVRTPWEASFRIRLLSFIE